jgi:hypothetical protein
MAFRGAHWFPSASGVPFHRRLIDRVLARYKMNRAVIECEEARWDSHPEIAAPNSVSKNDLRGLVRLCRRDYVEPIPLVNGPGHAGWIFRNGKNTELAEDPAALYAYCVNHPGSQAFMREILTEAIDVFHPGSVHLGHDEVTMRGQFPSPGCPRCAGKRVPDLFLQNLTGLRDWLAATKIRTVIWGDMLLAPEEGPRFANAAGAEDAKFLRARVPADVLIADWQYNTGPAYPSLGLFRAAGRETLACSWWSPENVYRMAQAARQNGSVGLLQTTWAGHFPDEGVLGTAEIRQFSAFVLAAEYAWTGRTDAPSALGYDPVAEFRRAYYGADTSSTPGASAKEASISNVSVGRPAFRQAANPPASTCAW